eukprot:scaffold68043_cov32-Tisochrysis_lutea.AAC.4
MTPVRSRQSRQPPHPTRFPRVRLAVARNRPRTPTPRCQALQLQAVLAQTAPRVAAAPPYRPHPLCGTPSPRTSHPPRDPSASLPQLPSLRRIYCFPPPLAPPPPPYGALGKPEERCGLPRETRGASGVPRPGGRGSRGLSRGLRGARRWRGRLTQPSAVGGMLGRAAHTPPPPQRRSAHCGGGRGTWSEQPLRLPRAHTPRGTLGLSSYSGVFKCILMVLRWVRKTSLSTVLASPVS